MGSLWVLGGEVWVKWVRLPLLRFALPCALAPETSLSSLLGCGHAGDDGRLKLRCAVIAGLRLVLRTEVRCFGLPDLARPRCI